MSQVLKPELGARLQTDGQTTSFRVWAPKAKRVKLQLIQRIGQLDSVINWHRMKPGDDGVFSAQVTAPAGTLYRFELDDAPARPDPRSMFQPFGVHGPSQVVDHSDYQWQDDDWRGVRKRDLVIYELHIGSFTQQGTYTAAINRLDDLVDIGITAIEVLPLAQSPGRWNWGYDGVNFFAPRNSFGTPNQLKEFVDACHIRGIAVIVDVVYNHVGPEGNYLSNFGPYASRKHRTPWGDAFNFDGKQAAPVRQFVIDNAMFWIDEYHFDGLRLDAVHYMFDDSSHTILDSVRNEFRQRQVSWNRETYLIGEANIYDPDLVGGPLDTKQHFDAIWSDCLMHSIIKIGEPELKLTDRNYTTLDLRESLEHGYVFTAPGAARMTPMQRDLHHPTGDKTYVESLITALQTHDSVGNHPHGSRLHQLTDIEFQMAAAPLILLYPSIPMIFMGEESAIKTPFPFFADFEDPRLRKAVDRGRKHEYPHHNWNGSPLPSDERAFRSSVFKTDLQRDQVKLWYRDLLALRKRGIADGWLNIANLTCNSDPEKQIHQLQYQGSSKTVVICCRLDRSSATAVTGLVNSSNSIILNSLSHRDTNPAAAPKNDNSIIDPDLLLPRQCLIWIKNQQ